MLSCPKSACVRAALALACLFAASDWIRVAAASASSPTATPDVADGETQARLASAYGKLPLAFEENRGQTDASVRFLARGPGYRTFLTPDGVVITLHQDRSPHSAHDATEARQAAVKVRYIGASAQPRMSGEDALPSRSNYFIGGDHGRTITDIPHYARVRCSQIYPGIDLVYYGNQRQLEYDFVVAPHGDPESIKLHFEGAESLHITPDGDLVMRTAAGELRQHRPQLYQEVDGARHMVEGEYIALGDDLIGFRVGAYDRSRLLVIDPIFSYSTFLGGRSTDAGTAITVDSAGNAYVAGWTNSSDFPTVNAYQRRIGKNYKAAFIAKLNPTGTALIYSTYLGGSSGTHYATGIAIDAAGNAYVTGSTDGTTFPTTSDAYQGPPSSGGGAFVAKLGPTGNTLAYSTYLLYASNTRIAVDSAGNAYIGGQASAGFATTAGAFQTTMSETSGGAPFVFKLNATGTAAVYATFVGGSGTDTFKALTLDVNGNAYVAGSTTSADFPLANALQAYPQGALDGFVTKLNATGSGLVYSTYLGGVLDDSVNAIAVDQDGNAYLAGETYSSNFPIKNAFQPVKAGSHTPNSSLGNGFVTKLSAAGDVLLYSSFLGGEVCYPYYCYSSVSPQYRGDAAYGIAVDDQGHAIVTGLARSYTFPLADSRLPQKTQDYFVSLFVTKVGIGGRALVYSSLIYTGMIRGETTVTGIPTEAGQAIAVDSSGNAYLTYQGDYDFPTTAGAFQTTSPGGPSGPDDAVVFKLSSGAVSLSVSASANSVTHGQSTTLSANVIGAAANTSIIFYDGHYVIGSAPIVGGVATFTTTLPVGIHTFSAVYRDGTSEADAPPIIVVVNPAMVCN